MICHMASLLWKRKRASHLKDNSAAIFKTEVDEEQNDAETISSENSGERKRVKFQCHFEDVERLMQEGIILAEQQKYREAIQIFDNALKFSPNEAKLYEMKAQILLELNEVFLAVQAATKAVGLNPLWAEAFQTLGRTQINFGDIKMGLRSLCIAIHLKPDFMEIYKEDLAWALDLKSRQKEIEEASRLDSREGSQTR